MASLHRIDDGRSAAALADLLNGSTRTRPVVVVTIPSGQTDPWIDAERIAGEAGDLAEVYLMPTGALTWEFSRRMADGTQVYGGAGRAYPVGHEWASDLTRSPLRFAFDAHDGERATDQLISDMLRMAAAAGLLHAPASKQALKQVTGVVRMLVAGRALVDVGEVLPAALAEELTVADVPVAQIVTVGQQVEGVYDAESNRIDVRRSLRSAGEALAGYAPGDVVLARVATVAPSEALLTLYPPTTTPAVTVAVHREDVTTNPHDDLSSLMTVGEVIPARVVATGQGWRLTLHDVDDDEPVVEAPPLLVGGPPWLVEEGEAVEVADEAPLAAPRPSLPAAPTPVEREADEPLAVQPLADQPLTPAPLRVSPALLDKRRSRRTHPPAAARTSTASTAGSTQALLRKIDGLTAELGLLRREQDGLRSELLAACDEREQLRYLLDQAERRANRAEHELKAVRARLRKAGSSKTVRETVGTPQFADPEQGFRHLVVTRWATRTLPTEQADRPLPDYLVGPDFLTSLEELEGIRAEKVADVVVEILTGLASHLPGRDVHHLRTGTGGDAPVRVREDGAVAWRASLQTRTPSARRIHYWKLLDGRVELGRVTTHDDFDV